MHQNEPCQNEIVSFLKQLRERIIAAFETLEPVKRFERKAWQHHSGGGGEISLLRGQVFEKAAVNWSGVRGENFPTQEAAGPFFATGISLITHMMNPYAPTVHMNIRFIQTKEKFWFGGGYDLTPMGYPFQEDTDHFHQVAKKTLAPYALYEPFAQNARDYFTIPHLKRERGVGGIFFDHYNTGDFARDISMWQNVGTTFLDAIMPILERRVARPYTEVEKEKQLQMRAHYVEFNLLYDRGTRFGFLSGGNPEAILCSMPPVAKW
jgi:coproporphyrinogen III oxidase